MKSNLDDKYKTFNQQTKVSGYSTTQRRLANYQNKYIINEQGSKILSKIDNKPILKNGSDWQTVHDYWFAADVSYIRWSNQTVYNNMAKTIDPKLISEMNKTYDWINVLTQDKKQIIFALANFGFSKVAGKISTLLEKGSNIASRIGSRLGVSVAAGELPVNIAGIIQNNQSEIIKGLEDLAISTSLIILEVFLPGVGPLLSFLWNMAHVIGPGNGASFIENWNDHGLNDWEYQIKHNFINMAKTAHNFSNNYKEGIMWKITDGWFSLPEIWVGSQKSGTPWKFISPGPSFNFGNKLGVWYP